MSQLCGVVNNPTPSPQAVPAVRSPVRPILTFFTSGIWAVKRDKVPPVVNLEDHQRPEESSHPLAYLESIKVEQAQHNASLR